MTSDRGSVSPNAHDDATGGSRASSRAGISRTRDQVNAGLDGCDHDEILHLRAGEGHPGVGDFDQWECGDCGQQFGPIFFETPRRA